MNLPNYFLADLPPDAPIAPGMISDACDALRRNREAYLEKRSTESLIETLAELAADWLRPDYTFRRLALAGAAQSGFSAEILSRGLDQFFEQLTVENLQALLVQELGHPRRLDDFVHSKGERELERAARVHGPELLVHVAAGNIPNPILSSMVLGLLVHSAQFVKCASGASYLPRLFAHSLYETDPKLASCLELAEWAGGRLELEAVLFREANCVTATGSDETLQSIRDRLRVGQRFLGYGHRVSLGFIARDGLGRVDTPKVIAHAAEDVAAWNQLGCLSPHVFYVETGGRITPQDWAELLAAELGRLEEARPRGPVPDAIAASVATRRHFYELRGAHSAETRLWASPGSTAWTVVYESDPLFQSSCLHRFVYVKPVGDCGDVLKAADAVRGRVSTIGLAASEERAREVALAFSRWGATRICPLGQMQRPPLTWRHDGRSPLADLVTWSDWECSSY